MATPLYKKLGIKENTEIIVLNSPKNYTDFFLEFPDHVVINTTKTKTKTKVVFVHIFVRTVSELDHFYALGKSCLTKDGMLWISWPKKTASFSSEVDKTMVMNYGLNNGLVDVKVAAIDENWSGHKFVYRLKDR